jgi:protein-tyrosine-phosphatase
VNIPDTILLWFLLLLSTSAWSSILVHWTSSALPPAHEFGISDLVISWNGDVSPLMKAGQKQGYRVYVEVSLQQVTAAAEQGFANGWAGIILNVHPSERAELEKVLPRLRSAYPKMNFLLLDPDGKQPMMRGSLVIKRDSVLEVSSPTEQPWIDTNLSLVKIEQRFYEGQAPLYTFVWGRSDSDQQQRGIAATDYSLAVAEAGAFHADLILELDEHLQKALSNHDPEAWTLWNQVRSYADFYSHTTGQGLEAAANVAVVVDDLDTSEETINLLARHNIPFRVLRAADLKSEDVAGIEVVVVFAKPDRADCERIANLATRGKTVVLVDAHGSYPWQDRQPVRLNEHAVSYDVGKGRLLELSEPVTDPETFAQDIRRLLGKQNQLMSLWNALTTVAVPYQRHDGTLRTVELVNYAAEPLRLQVQVKGSFAHIRYESPERGCCESLVATKHDGFTEFVIPDLRISGRAHLEVGDSQTRP